jgi:hypothetical protein
VAEKDVFRDGELVEEHRLLMNRRDPGAGRRKGGRKGGLRVAEPDGARIRLIDAGQYLDERRLAGAVLADERRHRAGIESERDIGKSAHARKGLRYAFKRNGGLHPRCGCVLQQEWIHQFSRFNWVAAKPSIT